MSTNPTRSPVVVADQVRKTFAAHDGTRVAVDGVSFAAHAGELTALVGADGAGKTTMLRMLAGLLAPDAGTLRVLDIDVAHDPHAVQTRIRYMPQRFGLYEDLSVQENLTLYADLHGVAQTVRRTRFARLLDMTDLARFTARPAGKLSGGMKQKLGLACTLVHSPDLLLLDEPSVGVDPLSRHDLWTIVQQLVEHEGLSVIVSTAYMDEAERCTRVFMLHQGRVLAAGAPQDLSARAAGLCFRATPAPAIPARAVQARLLDAEHGIVDAVPRGGAVCFVQAPDADGHTWAHVLGDVPYCARPAELEDAFMLLLHESRLPLPDPLPHAGEGVKRSVSTPAQTEIGARASFPSPAGARECPAGTGEGKAGEPVIVVRDLVRRFGDFVAVASTSFTVARGEIFGLLGPNGAGKTTTFRMLCGLLPATSGHLEVAGVNLHSARARARARIGYVAQKFSLYGQLSVADNLAFFGAAYGLHGRLLAQRIQAVQTQFALDPKAVSGRLPAGYQQRLVMAAALLHQPDILFLDEPTSGIDPLARRAFWRSITTLAQAGVTVVITTHFMEEAEYCDRIAIQDAGKLLALGSPHDIRAQVACADMNSAFIAIVEQGRGQRQVA